VVDKQQQIEMIGKVFVVACGIRRCLICDRVFTPKEAAEHASVLCYSVLPVTTSLSTLRRE
jgi:hypothetical protein